MYVCLLWTLHMNKLVAKYVPFCALTVKTDFEIRSDLSHDVFLIWLLNLTQWFEQNYFSYLCGAHCKSQSPLCFSLRLTSKVPRKP